MSKEDIFKEEFEDFVKKYSDILKEYWPSHDINAKFGFTEINLTANFINCYICKHRNSICWYEVELSTTGRNSQRVDGMIIDRENNRLILIESKRLAKKSLFVQAKNDLKRISEEENIKYILKNIKNYQTFNECISIVIADIWVNESKHRIVENYYSNLKENIKSQFLLDKIVNTDTNRNDIFHIIVAGNKINIK